MMRMNGFDMAYAYSATGTNKIEGLSHHFLFLVVSVKYAHRCGFSLQFTFVPSFFLFNENHDKCAQHLRELHKNTHTQHFTQQQN